MKELQDDNRLYWGSDGTSQSPRIKVFLTEAKKVVPRSVLKYKDVGHTQSATSEFRKLLPGMPFDYPKPSSLIAHLINLVSECDGEDDFIVMDFFAGSGTTGHSVYLKNAEDGGKRNFICVQLPEPIEAANVRSIAEITKERFRRSASSISEKQPDYSGDLGFKVFKLDSTNIKPWEVDFDLTERTLEDFISNIKSDRREEDVLYEILLKYGLDLTLPITEHTIAGQKVFNIGMGALIICLADDISLEVVEGIAKLKDELNPEIMRVVFKDSGFKDDVVKTNAVQILKQAGIVDVRSL